VLVGLPQARPAVAVVVPGPARVTVGTVVGLLASGKSHQDVLADFPYLEEDDILAALACAAWRAEELELPLTAS
jgi:uncharacterized protein (DUF433 family)